MLFHGLPAHAELKREIIPQPIQRMLDGLLEIAGRIIIVINSLKLAFKIDAVENLILND
jgi:hypothetical protein